MNVVDSIEKYERIHPPVMLVGEELDEEFNESLDSVLNCIEIDSEHTDFSKNSYYN